MKTIRIYLLGLVAVFFLFSACDDGGGSEDTVPRPTVDFTFSPDSPVAGQSISFTGTATNASSYQWTSNPAGFTGNALNATHTFNEPGIYQVTLRATGEGGTAQASKTITVAAPAPTADFNFSPQNPRVGESVSFSSTVSNASSYQWSSNPPGFSSSQANPSHSFSEPGTYTITLEATGEGGTVSVSKELSVLFNITNKRRRVFLENSKIFTSPEATEPILTQHAVLQVVAEREDNNETVYFFPPNALLKGVSPVETLDTAYLFRNFEYSNPFEFSYGEVPNYVASHSSSGGADLFPVPEPNALPGTLDLVNTTVLNFANQFPATRITITSLANGESVSYLRNVEADGRMILVRSENLNPSQGFKVRIAVDYTFSNSTPDANGWLQSVRSTSAFEFFTAPPASTVADFSFSPQNPIAGQTIIFTNLSSNATSYQWSSDQGGFSSTAANPSFAFSQPGNYTVTLVATGPGGSNQISKTITVAAPAPVADFSFSPSDPIAGETVSFTNLSSNATSYQWSSSPAGFSSTEENPSFAFSEPGTYTITLVATGPGGSDEISKTITVAAPAPVADFSFSPTAPVEGETVSFTNLSANATSYQWSSDPAGFNSTEENPQFAFSEAGTFAITLVATGPGGTNQITKSITVTAPPPAPIASFTFSPANPKAGEDVTFTNTSTNADSFLWTFSLSGSGGARLANNSFTSTDTNPVVTFPDQGNWSVVLQATGPGGTVSSPATFIDVAPAEVGGGGDDNPCNLPSCYVSQTVTNGSGGTITSNYSYTTVNGKKVLSQLQVITGAGGFGVTTTTNYDYNAQGQRIRSTTSRTILGTTTITVIVEYEYDGLGRLTRENTLNESNVMVSYITYSHLGSTRNIDRINSYDQAGVLQNYSIYDQYTGNDYGRVRNFEADGTLETTSTYTWENCQQKTIITVAASTGATILNQVNQFGSNRLISSSTSTIRDLNGGNEQTATTTYSYNCD